MTGDVLHNKGAGYAMAMGMVGILGHDAHRLHSSCSGARSAGCDDGRPGTNRLGHGHRGDAGRVARSPPVSRERKSRWRRWRGGRLHQRASCTSSCRSSATFDFSLRAVPLVVGVHEHPSRTRSFFSSLGYSFIVGFITIVLSIALLVPTAFWVRLRVPRAAPVRRVHHPAAVRHPADRPRVRPHRTYSRPPLPFTHTDIGQHRAARLRLRRRCRSRTCTGRSTRACGRWTSRA